jgi:hypothetical protein
VRGENPDVMKRAISNLGKLHAPPLSVTLQLMPGITVVVCGVMVAAGEACDGLVPGLLQGAGPHEPPLPVVHLQVRLRRGRV